MSYIKLILLLIASILGLPSVAYTESSPKVLHLTFHRGCQVEFERVAKALNLDVTTWFIPDLPRGSFDGISGGNALYNIGEERAKRIWLLHRETFEKFDAILTSDTAPLARVFLQHGWTKPLIIWICNRFDYSDQGSLDCSFPDAGYYRLFQEAQQQKNVITIAYTAFEHYYAQSQGIDTGNLIITPCAPEEHIQSALSAIPNTIDKNTTFFLPPYHNERHFIDLEAHCRALAIPVYRGRYHGANDLVEFKGIIHLPYSWSNLALFENMSLGIPYFLPSPAFFRQLAAQKGYFHPNLRMLLDKDLLYLSEWYGAEHSSIMTYFDSWEDLQHKIATTDYIALRARIRAHAVKQRATMLERWRWVFEKML
jgi:hypothetical protein